ncbi:MAG TPA: hypothetical protein VI815_04620 [Candidatus Nanoarchaeia archaeon]|nr:hypothetical protein [Candidatus Nanoarchaeia archaeon]
MENSKENTNKEFTITKKIAKHGTQSIIVIPRILESQLKPGTITKLTIEILENDFNNKKGGKK